MADQIITITVPQDKIPAVLSGYLALYPNSEIIPNPDYVEGSEEPETILKYSNAQWIREKVRQNFVRDVRRGLQVVANAAVQVEQDDSIAV